MTDKTVRSDSPDGSGIQFTPIGPAASYASGRGAAERNDRLRNDRPSSAPDLGAVASANSKTGFSAIATPAAESQRLSKLVASAEAVAMARRNSPGQDGRHIEGEVGAGTADRRSFPQAGLPRQGRDRGRENRQADVEHRRRSGEGRERSRGFGRGPDRARRPRWNDRDRSLGPEPSGSDAGGPPGRRFSRFA